MKLSYYFILSLVMSSCVHSIHQVHTSDFTIPEDSSLNRSLSKEMGTIIKAKEEQFVVLGLTKQTNYINQAYDQLLKQCDGPITGITTQLSSSLGFFSWTN